MVHDTTQLGPVARVNPPNAPNLVQPSFGCASTGPEAQCLKLGYLPQTIIIRRPDNLGG